MELGGWERKRAVGFTGDGEREDLGRMKSCILFGYWWEDWKIANEANVSVSEIRRGASWVTICEAISKLEVRCHDSGVKWPPFPWLK